MASVPDVDDGCAKILVPLIRFLGGPSPRRPAVEKPVVSLIVVLSTAYVASDIVERFAVLVLAYLHLVAASSLHPVLLFFALVFAWLLVTGVLLAAFFFFLGTGKTETTGPGSVQLERDG